jgi:signal recognition particle subunit SRP54
MREARLDFEDLLQQIRQIQRMGPFEQLLKLLPGYSQLRNQLGDMAVDELALKRAEAIILSMTPKERRHPEILDYSRKLRIARGSGTKLEEVNALVRQLMEMRRLMKQLAKQEEQLRRRKWTPFGRR